MEALVYIYSAIHPLTVELMPIESPNQKEMISNGRNGNISSCQQQDKKTQKHDHVVGTTPYPWILKSGNGFVFYLFRGNVKKRHGLCSR